MKKNEAIKLIEKALDEVQQKYPQVTIDKISYDSKEIWVDLITPELLIDNDEFNELKAKLTTDLLIDHHVNACFLSVKEKVPA